MIIATVAVLVGGRSALGSGGQMVAVPVAVLLVMFAVLVGSKLGRFVKDASMTAVASVVGC